MYTAAQINALPRAAFVALLGGVFEHSAWVAERAYQALPVASREALHAAMVEAVESASRDQQLCLLYSHPELAGKEAADGALTASSASEQASAGLSALTHAEVERIAALNCAYREKFGFPFIIAVREHTRSSIFAEFERRLAQDAVGEFETALEQVYRITAMRLASIIE
jgi:2-oxo-4-hydroxy-4-carboxy-5-ureidoimidazoline decarboxylase